MAGNNSRQLTFYAADSGEIHVMRIAETTLSLQIVAGTDQVVPSGPPTSDWWYKASRGQNEYGGKPRQVGVCFTGVPPAGLEAGPTYTVSVLTPGQWALATIRSVVSYQGADAIVVSKSPESIYPGI